MYELAVITLPPLVGLAALAGQLWWGVSAGERAAAGPAPSLAKRSKLLVDWRERGVWRSNTDGGWRPRRDPATVPRTGPRPAHYAFAYEVLPWLAREGYLARYLAGSDDDWLLVNWLLAEDRTGCALRPEGLDRLKLHAGDLRVDVVRLPRPEREVEAMFVGFAEDAGELRVFTLEHPVGASERFVFAEQTARKRLNYGAVDALSAKEFVELVGAAVRGELEPELVVDRPGLREEAVAGRRRSGSGQVVFD